VDVNLIALPSHSGRRADPGADLGTPMHTTLDVLRGRHTVPILWSLFWGEKRFYQVLRDLGCVTRKTLDHELARLERLGLVERRGVAFGRPQASYALTPTGETLKPVVGVLFEWGLLARRLPIAARLAAERSARLRNPIAGPRAARSEDRDDDARLSD
jgi:DNA-binding HxlR family transcriptional regulator